MNERPTYALILLKGFGIGDLMLERHEEHYSKKECEAALNALLNDPSTASRGVRYGAACVLMQGKWAGSYSVR